MDFTVCRADGTAHPIFGGFLAISGIFALGLGLISGILHQRDLAAYTGRATGVVVAFHRLGIATAQHTPTYAPVVQFTTASGEPKRFTSNVATNPPRFSIGQRVSVAYDPANPSHATIDSFFDNWMFPLILAGGGLPFFLIGLMMARARPAAGSALAARQAA